MRVLHTADFHAGRLLKGFDRTPEIHAALTEIAGLARTEKADAVLVSGDLFDTPNPSAGAEAALFDFFLQLRDAEIPSVVIAGNHDSAARLDSVAGLLGWVGVQVVAQPTGNPQAMVREIQTKSGERLRVGALPYLSERRLIKAVDLLGGDIGTQRQKYREGMGFFLRELGKGFEAGAVNMLMAHTTMDGAKPSGSERTFELDLTNAYTVSGLQLPAGAQYVALGHIHKPQTVCEAPLASYPGSVIQLDFGESGEKKQVNLVEVYAGQPARVEAIPLASGRELRSLRTTPEQAEKRVGELVSSGFSGLARVVVEVQSGAVLTGLKDRLLGLSPSILSVELGGKQEDLALPQRRAEGLSRLQLFEQYWQEKRGALPDDVRAAFVDVEARALEVTE